MVASSQLCSDRSCTDSLAHKSRFLTDCSHPELPELVPSTGDLRFPKLLWNNEASPKNWNHSQVCPRGGYYTLSRSPDLSQELWGSVPLSVGI